MKKSKKMFAFSCLHFSMVNMKNKKKAPHHPQQQQGHRDNGLSENFEKLNIKSSSEENIEVDLYCINRSQDKYRVAQSEIYGRYLAAARDLKPGEILITEKPLAIGPCVSGDPVCLGCYMPVTLKTSQYRCPSCQWPLCGPNCRGLNHPQGHFSAECELLKKENSAEPLKPSASPVQVRNLYELVIIVRILLLKRLNPELYRSILLMESHLEMRKLNAELWRHYESNVVIYLRDNWHMAEQFTSEEIHTICGILDVNCFEIGQNHAKARTLYPIAFLLAHDCCPNTAHTDDPFTYEVILRTSRSIRKNETITLSYAYTLQGTWKRRDFMQAGKLFWCCCKRCADPFELGSDCSALKCEKCKKGLIRAMDPLNQEAEWKCDKCPFKLTAKEIVKILDQINNDLESIDVHDVAGLENFLKRYSEMLGPNHYLLLSAKYSLCQLYGKIEGYLLPSMSLDNLKKKQTYCQDFLKIVNILEPGLTRLRGLIMYELHAPIMMMAQYLMMQNQINRRDFNKMIKEVMYLLKESSLILKMEPVGSSEHAMALAAEDALRKMTG